MGIPVECQHYNNMVQPHRLEQKSDTGLAYWTGAWGFSSNTGENWTYAPVEGSIRVLLHWSGAAAEYSKPPDNAEVAASFNASDADMAPRDQTQLPLLDFTLPDTPIDQASAYDVFDRILSFGHDQLRIANYSTGYRLRDPNAVTRFLDVKRNYPAVKTFTIVIADHIAQFYPPYTSSPTAPQYDIDWSSAPDIQSVMNQLDPKTIGTQRLVDYLGVNYSLKCMDKCDQFYGSQLAGVTRAGDAFLFVSVNDPVFYSPWADGVLGYLYNVVPLLQFRTADRAAIPSSYSYDTALLPFTTYVFNQGPTFEYVVREP